MKNLILVAALLLSTSGCTCHVVKGAYVRQVPAPVAYHQPRYNPPVVQRGVRVREVYQPPVRVARTRAPAPAVNTTTNVRITNVNVARTTLHQAARQTRQRTTKKSRNSKVMYVQPNAGRVQINGSKKHRAHGAFVARK